MALTEKKSKAIAAYISKRCQEYVNSNFVSNWKLQCESIRDAVDQKWRKGEQLTRSGFYFAHLRARRDGLSDGFTQTYGTAKPLILYKKRRAVPDAFKAKATEEMENTWADIGGLSKWLSLVEDCIDWGMGVGYTRWVSIFDEIEAPMIQMQASAEMFQITPQLMPLMQAPDIERVHPLNWRGDTRRGFNLSWEAIEREYSLAQLSEMVGDQAYDQRSVKIVMTKLQQRKARTESETYYNRYDEQGNNSSKDPKVYAIEYWGRLDELDGFEKDKHEYKILVCEGEILHISVNYLRIGANVWRPITRVRFRPMNDLPIGRHPLVPSLPHSKMLNYLTNLGVDDVAIRAHLGLAYWPSALKNPNQMLNPTGVKGAIEMRSDANVNQIPRFFADQRSGVMSDSQQLMTWVDRDSQSVTVNDQSLGLAGGPVGDTATQSRLLASASNMKLVSMLTNAGDTGLLPIAQTLTTLTIKNRPENFQLSNDELFFLWHNNFWELDQSVTTDIAQEAFNLERFAQAALPHMMNLTTPDGSAEHVAKFIKDLGSKFKIPRHRLDEYFPEGSAPQVQTQAQGGQPQPGQATQGQQPEPQGELIA